MATIIGLACFAGVVVFGALFILMVLKGGPLKIPAIGMGVFFLLVVAVGAMTHFGIGPFGDPAADENAEPTGAVESQDVSEDETAEPDGLDAESEQPEEDSGEESEPPSENNSVSPDDINPSQGVMDIDAAMAILRVTLADNFGKDSYTLEYDDKSVTINVWQDGIAEGSVYAAAGDSTAKAAWEFMIEGQKLLCNSVVEQIQAAGAQDYHVMINVLNDLDHSRTLLSILDGTVVYDTVDS